MSCMSDGVLSHKSGGCYMSYGAANGVSDVKWRITCNAGLTIKEAHK